MRSVDGPGALCDDGAFVSSDTAAQWLGIRDTLFERIVQQESAWLRPVRIGRRVVWDWEDIFALRRILKGRGGAPEEES